MTTLVQKKRTSAIVMALVAAGMLALGFAAVPLYRMFCQVTGFNGTTQRAVPGSSVQVAAGHTMSIRFDSNVTPGMPWKFYPEHPTDKVRSEEHTSELQSLMRISYAVFCLKN